VSGNTPAPKKRCCAACPGQVGNSAGRKQAVAQSHTPRSTKAPSTAGPANRPLVFAFDDQATGAWVISFGSLAVLHAGHRPFQAASLRAETRFSVHRRYMPANWGPKTVKSEFSTVGNSPIWNDLLILGRETGGLKRPREGQKYQDSRGNPGVTALCLDKMAY